MLVDWARQYLHAQHSPGDSLATDAHTVRTHLLITCTPEQLAAAAEPHQARPALAELLNQQHRQAGAGPVCGAVVGDDTPLSRGALRRLACDATLDLVVRWSAGSAGRHTCPDHRPAGHPHGGAGQPCPHLTDPLHVGRSTRTVTGRQFRALVVRDRTCVARGCHRPPAQCAAHHVRHWTDGGTTDLNNLVLLCHQHHHDHHDRGLDLDHHDGTRRLTQTGWATAPP